MANISIDFGDVDVSILNSESDFHREADKKLPTVIEEVAKISAEAQWDSMSKAARSGVLKFRATKQTFIAEKTRDFANNMPYAKKQKLREQLIAHLHDLKDKKPE